MSSHSKRISKFSGENQFRNWDSDKNRPSLLRTSSGHGQVLPSRFNDSALDDEYSSSTKRIKRYTFEHEQSSLQHCNMNLFDVKVEYGSLDYNGYRGFDTKRSSWSCMTSIRNGYSRREVEGFRGKLKMERDEHLEEKDWYELDYFVAGDLVWAKSGKKYPAWPAIVIDPIIEAPEPVLRDCVLGTICVMYFGYAKNGLRDYAWVKAGMIFPFREYMDRFQGQTPLYGSKPNDFQMAIKEAFQQKMGILKQLLKLMTKKLKK